MLSLQSIQETAVMNSTSIKVLRAIIAVTLFVSMSCFARTDASLVIFGDSLSDSGNYFINSGEFSTRPYEAVPSAPYAIGGFHFTNGRTWIEELASMLHDRRSSGPALRASRTFSNYAYGRARSRPGAPSFPVFDLGTQVGLFLNDFGNNMPVSATYVIWTGSNDIQDALFALAGDPTGAASFGILQAAITATADNIVALWSNGARNFLVPSAPNIAITPAIKAAGPLAEIGAMQLSVGYNMALSQALESLDGLPGIRITRLDVFTILNDLVANPELAGLTNVTESCIRPGATVGAVCRTPDQYLFWDGIHPTRAGHKYLAINAAAALADE